MLEKTELPSREKLSPFMLVQMLDAGGVHLSVGPWKAFPTKCHLRQRQNLSELLFISPASVCRVWPQWATRGEECAVLLFPMLTLMPGALEDVVNSEYHFGWLLCSKQQRGPQVTQWREAKQAPGKPRSLYVSTSIDQLLNQTGQKEGIRIKSLVLFFIQTEMERGVAFLVNRGEGDVCNNLFPVAFKVR